MKRLESLDVLRGFDMVWIVGLSWAVTGFCRLFPGGADSWLAMQFRHVPWEGLAFYDTIFPLFVFIAGVSFPFSYAKQRERGDSALSVHLRIFRRAGMLVLLGMIYNGALQFRFENFRYASVLGKIGIAWAVAALWYVHLGVKGRLAVCFATLAGYWALLQVTAPDAPPGAGPFTPEGCFPGYLDRIGFTPGRFYMAGKLEPSGFPVSFFGSATAMMGMLAGDLLMSAREGLTPSKKSAFLAVTGVAAGFAGWLVSFSCPVIKNLWSPSFMLVVGGYSFLMLAFFYWLVDVKGWRRGTVFFKVVGVNSIAVYMFCKIVDCRAISRFLFGGVASWFPEKAFVESLGAFLVCWSFCWFLNRQKIYFKV